MFFVYMLRCNDGSYYVGHTDNLEIRMSGHYLQTYECSYTATRLPVVLMFVQTFSSRQEAFAAERKIKGWGREKKEALIRGDWNEISKLAKKDFKRG